VASLVHWLRLSERSEVVALRCVRPDPVTLSHPCRSSSWRWVRPVVGGGTKGNGSGAVSHQENEGHLEYTGP
jgi:hypothetical protein